jgi:hypothetical protein
MNICLYARGALQTLITSGVELELILMITSKRALSPGGLFPGRPSYF